VSEILGTKTPELVKAFCKKHDTAIQEVNSLYQIKSQIISHFFQIIKQQCEEMEKNNFLSEPPPPTTTDEVIELEWRWRNAEKMN